MTCQLDPSSVGIFNGDGDGVSPLIFSVVAFRVGDPEPEPSGVLAT